MTRMTIITIAFFFASCTASKVSQTVKAPRVFAMDAQLLEKNKNKVIKKEADLMPAFGLLLKEATDGLQHKPVSVVEKKNVPPSGDKHDYMSLAPYHWPDPSKPGGLPYMRKDGETNPEVRDYLDKEYMPKVIKVINTLAQAYYFSNDERYAQHAALLIRTWFLDSATKMNPNLNYAQAIKGVNTGRGAGLIDARHFIKVVDAIGLIATSKHWKTEDQQGMKRWFAEFLNWMQTSENGVHELATKNNHGTWYDAQRLSYALFIDSTDLARRIVANAKARLNEQMDESGKFPKEMERTTSFHYSSFNLQAFFTLAQMAEKVGIDFWNYTSPKGNSLKKGFDTLKPYLTNQKQWQGQQIKPYDFQEDAFPLLMIASAKMNCSDCRGALIKLAAKDAAESRLNLLY